MAQWQTKIRLAKFYNYPESTTLDEVKAEIVSELERIRPEIESKWSDHLEGLDDLVEGFEDFVQSEEDFDEMLENLYDWADTRLDDDPIGGKKLCWIEKIRS